MNSELRENEAESFNESSEVKTDYLPTWSVIRYLLYRLT